MLIEAKPHNEDPRFRLRREHQQKHAFHQAGPAEERDQDRQRAARPHIVRENDGQPPVIPRRPAMKSSGGSRMIAFMISTVACACAKIEIEMAMQ